MYLTINLIHLLKVLKGGQNHVVVENIVTKANSQNSFSFKLNKLNELGLFKNIKGLPSNYTLAKSTATVRISVSYTNVDYKTRTKYTLYDSKCTTCNNGHTSNKPGFNIYFKQIFIRF